MECALNIHWTKTEEDVEVVGEGTTQETESSNVGNEALSLQAEEEVAGSGGESDSSGEEVIKEYLEQVRTLFDNLSEVISKRLLKPSVFTRAMTYVHNINRATFGAIQSQLATRINVKGKKPTKEQESEQCPICLNAFKRKKIVVLHCGHSYHESCMKQWLKYGGYCPLGRCNLK